MLLAALPFCGVFDMRYGVGGRYAWPLLPGAMFALVAFFKGRDADEPSPEQSARRASRSAVWQPNAAAVFATCVFALLFVRELRVLADPVQAYDRVVRREPAIRAAHLLAALAEERAGRVDEALARLAKLCEREPDYAKAWVNRGRLLWQRGESDKAEPVLRTAFRRFTKSSRAALTWGRFCYERRRWDDAAFAFEEALQRGKEPQAARYLCRVWLAKADVEAAREALEIARRLDPKHSSLKSLAREIALASKRR